MKRLQAREEIRTAEKAAVEQKTSPDLPVSELGLGSRNENALIDAGYTTAGALVSALNEDGDQVLLAVKGFGQKGLIDLKKSLRSRGYSLQSAE